MTAKDRLIIESAKKRFNTILEYVTMGMNEAGEDGQDPNADPNAMGGDPNAMGGDPSMGGDPNAMGGDPTGGMGGDPSMGGDGGPQGFNPQVGGQQGGDPSQMGGDPNAMGGMNDPMMAQADPSLGGGGMPDPTAQQDPTAQLGDNGDQPGADDDVVDITKLTDKQTETQHDIEHLDNKFSKIIKAIGNFEELLRNNDQKIEDLKTEFEKRNPTQIEKLGMQTAKSYPFNVTPEEYWKDKEATSNYRVGNDDNGKEQGQYVITKDDLDGDVDWKGIADSLDDDDEEDDNILHNQTLKNIMGI